MQTVNTQNITPFLWFDDQAEAAVHFYVELFENSAIENVSRYGEAGPGPEGSVMTISFRLKGVDFIALNGGPRFTFSPATSFLVNCATQSEVDDLWAKLTAEGSPMQCGWVTDKFGITWQIVPDGLSDVIAGDDPEGSQRAMEAMFGMKKLDIDALRRAYAG